MHEIIDELAKITHCNFYNKGGGGLATDRTQGTVLGIFSREKISQIDAPPYHCFTSTMHKTTHLGARKEIVFFDKSNPRSIVSMVPEPLSKMILCLKESPDNFLLGLSERKLRVELFNRGQEITARDERLRLQFWLEYDRIQSFDRMNGHSFDISYVIGRMISKEAFYKHYANNFGYLAWLLCPPVRYLDALEVALMASIEKLHIGLESVQVRDPNCPLSKLEWVFKVARELHTIHYGKTPIKEIERPEKPRRRGRKVSAEAEMENLPTGASQIEAGPDLSAMIALEREKKAELERQAEEKRQGGMR